VRGGLPPGLEAIACDIDRTLVAEDGVLRPRTRAALAGVLRKGIHVVLATGRMFRSTEGYARDAGIVDPVICYQGAVVADPESGRFVRHEPVPLELAREAIAEIERDGYPVNAYVDDRLYIAHPTPASERYASERHVKAYSVGDLRAWLSEPPTKLLAMGEPRALDGLAARLKPHFAGRLVVVKSLPWLLELSSPGATKGAALEFVAQHVGFSLERTAAFGDGENDLELFEHSAFGVAVADGDKRLLARADLVCPPAADEGVASVLEAYLDSGS
jgi:Cof subfamily protein (haloacid dehalogenase superfamily)